MKEVSSQGVPRSALLVGGAAVAVLANAVVVATVVDPDARLLTRVGFLSGLPHVLLGLYLWYRRPGERIGPLMVVFGASFLLPSLLTTDIPLLWTMGQFYDVSTAILVYVLLIFPFGRLPDLPSRVLAIAVAVGNTTFDLVTAMIIDPRQFGCEDCPRNLLLVSHQQELAELFVNDVAPALALVMSLTGVVLIVRYVRGSAPLRRALAPLLPLALVFAGVQLVFSLRRLSIDFLVDPTFARLFGYVVDATLLLLPIGIVVGALRQSRERQVRAADLVLALTDLPSPGRLQAAVARALGDPTVRLGVWHPDRGVHVDAAGDPVTEPAPGSGSTAAYVHNGDLPLAMIVHDEALRDDPGLLATVTAAVRLAVDNERLQAEVLERLREVEASRARIVEAADAERRRIERNLHDGAQQRLLSSLVGLRLARPGVTDEAAGADIDAAAKELEDALAELRVLARGLYPTTLAQAGLVAAVEGLAARCALPTTVSVAIDGPPPEPLAVAAYFVVAEGLSNAVKHAGARTAHVGLTSTDGHLVVSVRDDGRGGATTAQGDGGLAGLADRVAAHGGELQIESPAGGGTLVQARMPVRQTAPMQQDGG